MSSIVPSNPQPANQFSIFYFQDKYPIRTFRDDHRVPWFIAVDVCKAVDIADTSNAVKRLDDDEKGTYTVRTPYAQEFLTVNQSGLYSLILTSRKPEAKIFKRWITHEVIPSIMDTGSYSVQPTLPPSPMELFESMVALARAHEDRMNEHDRKFGDVAIQIEALTDQVNRADYHGVKEWCKSQHIQYTQSLLQEFGKKATLLSHERGYEVIRIPTPNEQYPDVGGYHKSVLVDACVPRQKPTKQLPLNIAD